MSPAEEETAFLRAIRVNPGEDTHRLAYADWLEENAGLVEGRCDHCKGERHIVYFKGPGATNPNWNDCPDCEGAGTAGRPDGRAARAELIRVQCELVTRNPNPVLPSNQRELEELRRRERELLKWNWGKLVEPNPFPTGSRCLNLVGDNTKPDETLWVFRRGFVDEVRLTSAAFLGGPCGRCDEYAGVGQIPNDIWLRNPTWLPCPDCDGTGRTPGLAKALFERHPIARVVLTDKEPYWNGGSWRWYNPNRQWRWYNPNRHRLSELMPEAAVPEEFFDQGEWSVGFISVDYANQWLSGRCVAYGRREGRLPPLPIPPQPQAG